MFPNIDPKKMQAVMKQMGVSQEDIDAVRVVIEKEDGKIVINHPSVTKIRMQGQESFQITGDVEETEDNQFSYEDVKTIMEKTGCSKKEAEDALEKTGDLADAIFKLSS
ncbi:MAG: nascent polypeptide-associated complex protein [Candidatus Nanoarchaeia archaeon]